jgi:non-ribosomal peptide synthetase component F
MSMGGHLVTEIMSDHSIYLRVSGVYVHEKLLSWRLTPPPTYVVPNVISVHVTHLLSARIGIVQPLTLSGTLLYILACTAKSALVLLFVHRDLADCSIATTWSRLDFPALCGITELDRISTFVARYLRTLGVRAEVIVPICFDKSAWAIVAMIGILKAGGAYVALDPGHPDARLTSIIEDVEAKVMIAAPQHAERFLPLVEKVVPLDPGLIDLLAQLPDAKLPEVSPTSPAIVVFTSGSTGKPKGIVLEHQTICSSLLANASKCQVGLGSRVFQFAAYVFDVSVGDIFISLMTGACICVPSPHDRMNNIAAAINKLEANVAFLTPTVASLLKPEDVPGLKRMVLAGEAATKENVRDWAGRLALNIFYGPAETTVYCAGTQPVSIHADPANLGHAHGARQWIVDRADHNKLVPIGCVGEILVEGPMVGQRLPQKS